MKIEEISDEQIKKAVANVRTSLLNKLPDPKECQHDFSPEFEQKMELLLKQNREKQQRKLKIRSVAAILILIFIGAFTWFITNQEAVAGFMKWVMREKKDQTIIHFYAPTTDSELPDFIFGWLPEGFEISEKRVLPNSKVITARGSSGKVIILEYQYVSESADKDYFGNSISKESTQVNGVDALFFSDAGKDSANMLFWSVEEIAFSVNAQMEKEDLVKIAENVKKE